MLEGIDISKWQPETPPLTGKDFVFVRASIGARADPLYGKHAATVKAAGKVLGAYHFGTGGVVTLQVDTFLYEIGSSTRLLALDLERNAAGVSMTDDQARSFIAAIHRRGYKIGLYHSFSGFPDLGQDWDWVAAWDYTTMPRQDWTFWQYRGSPLDLDRFSGTLSDLRKLAQWPETIVKPPVRRRTHTVQRDDTLWSLSIHYYGRGRYWYRIARANRILNPRSLRVGRELLIP